MHGTLSSAVYACFGVIMFFWQKSAWSEGRRHKHLLIKSPPDLVATRLSHQLPLLLLRRLQRHTSGSTTCRLVSYPAAAAGSACGTRRCSPRRRTTRARAHCRTGRNHRTTPHGPTCKRGRSRPPLPSQPLMQESKFQACGACSVRRVCSAVSGCA